MVLTQQEYENLVKQGFCNYKEGIIHYLEAETKCVLCGKGLCGWCAIECTNGDQLCQDCVKNMCEEL